MYVSGSTPGPPSVIPHAKSLPAKTAYTEALLPGSGLGPNCFHWPPPGPATEGKYCEKGDPISPTGTAAAECPVTGLNKLSPSTSQPPSHSLSAHIQVQGEHTSTPTPKDPRVARISSTEPLRSEGAIHAGECVLPGYAAPASQRRSVHRPFLFEATDLTHEHENS